MKKLATIVAASGLTLGLSACGGSTDNDAEQAVLDFGQAIQDEDFDAICDSFDPELVEAMDDCPKLFEEGGGTYRPMLVENWGEMGEDSAEMEIQGSEIDGDTATVTVKNDDEERDIPLKNIDDDWKISIEEM